MSEFIETCLNKIIAVTYFCGTIIQMLGSYLAFKKRDVEVWAILLLSHSHLY